MSSTRESIRQFITTNFYVPEPSKLADADSLRDIGLVDSTGVLEVIAFLENQLGVQVRDADIRPENLDSIERIDAYVAKRRLQPE